jgi:hypothetical protein
MSQLAELLSRNLPLHLITENEVRRTPFGQITFNVVILNGVAKMDTLNIVKNRRRKYKAERLDNVSAE